MGAQMYLLKLINANIKQNSVNNETIEKAVDLVKDYNKKNETKQSKVHKNGTGNV